MITNRIIPCLLLSNNALVKTVKYKDPGYIGDPINAIRIFNEKEVDELIFLDIHASSHDQRPNFRLIAEIATECFMPVSYGGGVASLENAQRIFQLGIEKISLNSVIFDNPGFVSEMAKQFGSQAVIASIDVKKDNNGNHEVYKKNGKIATGWDPGELAKHVENLGAGEILLNSIDHDGTQSGYDINLIKNVSDSIGIPVIACGGAGTILDFVDAIRLGGASACAVGSMVVYFGKNRAVLINFPLRKKIEKAFEM